MTMARRVLITACILGSACALGLFLWARFGSPGMWLGDQFAWARFVEPDDGAVLQATGSATQRVEVVGAAGFMVREVAVCADAVRAGHRGDQPTSEWQNVTVERGRFRTSLLLVPGVNRLAIQGKWWKHVFANSARVLLGDVFIVAGQSNAVGLAPSFSTTVSGDVRNADLGRDGVLRWRIGDDPQSANGKGSPWPMAGTQYSRLTGRPVGFINIAENGSSIRAWLPGGQLFQRLIDALEATKPNYARAILWAQGEADFRMSADEYADCLQTIIAAANERVAAGRQIPWVVAISSFVNGSPVEEIRKAQMEVVDAGYALRGPDTDQLGQEFRQPDLVHLSDAGMEQAASLWAEALHEHFGAAPALLHSAVDAGTGPEQSDEHQH